MSTPVVTVASGGLPVVELAAGKLGLPVTEATNGRGIAVTKVVGKPGLPVVFDTIGVLPPASPTIFNSADKTTGITLSGGGLIANSNSNPTNAVRTNNGSSTKFYFEVLWANPFNGYTGIASSTAAFAGWLGSAVGGSSINHVGAIYVNGVDSGVSLGSLPSNVVVCLSVDPTGKLIWYRANGGNWNASGTANPATGVGGISTAALGTIVTFPIVGMAAVASTCTANFGASAFAFTPPSGFGALVP